MIKLDVAGQLTAKQRLKLLELPAAKRKRLLGQLARKVRVAGRKNLRSQKGINGESWAPRKGQSQRKMLRGLSKRMTASADSKQATVGFSNPVVGRVARAQQDGINEIMTASKMQKLHGQPDYKAPATRHQARALREAGYKARKKGGKGFKNVSLRWITENLNQGQAGFILRLLRSSQPKQSWVIPLPSRSFLGASEKDINNMVQTIFNQTINARPARA
jgi:phage gpG-like protein